MGFEQYQPSPEEIKRAEDTMTYEQRIMSEKRERKLDVQKKALHEAHELYYGIRDKYPEPEGSYNKKQWDKVRNTRTEELTKKVLELRSGGDLRLLEFLALSNILKGGHNFDNYSEPVGDFVGLAIDQNLNTVNRLRQFLIDEQNEQMDKELNEIADKVEKHLEELVSRYPETSGTGKKITIEEYLEKYPEQVRPYERTALDFRKSQGK